jgi:hypothetical protein
MLKMVLQDVVIFHNAIYLVYLNLKAQAMGTID